VPIITRIIEQKRKANRRSIHLDGRFAFGCNMNVVAKFRLREGMTLSRDQVAAILQGEVRQECFDAAMKFLQARLHSRSELRTKLMRREYGGELIDGVLNDLKRLGYIDDARFAKTKALAAAQHRQHGRRRAMVELLKKGVEKETARSAVADVYEATDSLSIARRLAEKKASSLRKLEPLVARRRLAGMLARRGFEYDVVKPVIDEVLGNFN
jgi:regulatory protein